jgi:hypothetical protein
MIQGVYVWPGNGHIIRKMLHEPDAATGRPTLASGLVGVEAWLAAEPNGDPLHADLKVALTEYGETGEYAGEIPGTATAEHLGDFEDEMTIYEVVKYGDRLLANTPVTVRTERFE